MKSRRRPASRRRMMKFMIPFWRHISIGVLPIAAAVVVAVAAAIPASAMDGNVPDNRPATAAGEITAMYWHGLNRDPDAGGFNSYMWFANQNCRWGVLSASFQILNSAEAHNVWQNNPQRLAGMLYAALLNRPPDPGGLNTYTNAIAQRGLPWATASMMASDEYNLRLKQICPNPDETADMYSWQDAQTFVWNVLLHNAATEAIVCGSKAALDRIDAILGDTETPVTEFISATVGLAEWFNNTFGLDQSCGAVKAYLAAALGVELTVNFGEDNPVFIEFEVGSPSGLSQQRSFTIRVGPNPTSWTGYSGRGW
jgi:hypothetical protein